jgi:hypothetical protein
MATTRLCSTKNGERTPERQGCEILAGTSYQAELIMLRSHANSNQKNKHSTEANLSQSTGVTAAFCFMPAGDARQSSGTLIVESIAEK